MIEMNFYFEKKSMYVGITDKVFRFHLFTDNLLSYSNDL